VRARTRAAVLAFFAGIAMTPAVQAAGGHHAVDDAAILDAGTCEADSWFSRARGGERLLHAGTGCRFGPFELGGSAEYGRGAGSSETGYALQAKFATEVASGLSAGLSLNSGWLARARPRYQASTVAALLTWAPQDDIAVHLNLGRDFVHGGADENRGGVAVEWTVRAGWTVLGERYREQGTHFVRAGVRTAINERLSVDLSRAHRLSGPSPSNWTLGLKWQFMRP